MIFIYDETLREFGNSARAYAKVSTVYFREPKFSVYFSIDFKPYKTVT